jgi:hypothetical protein
VEQGTKSINLLLEDAKKSAINHKKSTPKITTASDLYGFLDGRKERLVKRQQEELEFSQPERHPQRPFKASDATGTAGVGGDDNEEATNTEMEKPPPPKTPTFQLLSRITSLTQHYLTSPTPTLRKSLLNLLATVCPALAPDEDAFLPLVNAVWPVLIERLYDPEAFVVIAACEALYALCATAGDFLTARFKTEWWDNGLGKWCRKVRTDAIQSQKRGKVRGRGNVGSIGVAATRPFGRGSQEEGAGIIIPIRVADGQLERKHVGSDVAKSVGGGGTLSGSGLGRFAQTVQVWNAVQNLLVAIVTHVQIDDDIFDQILPLLADAMDSQNPDARAALEAIDSDAVWLFMYERGMLTVEPIAHPVMADVKFVEV